MKQRKKTGKYQLQKRFTQQLLLFHVWSVLFSTGDKKLFFKEHLDNHA